MTPALRSPRLASPQHALAIATVLISCALPVLAACADESRNRVADRPPSSLAYFALDASPGSRWKLPDRLREISGLAITPDGRLLAHNDERGIVYELDVDDERIVKTFRLGREGTRADFEGIAVADGSVFLVASDGAIYEAKEGSDGEVVDFAVHDSGLGDRCELEGLEYELATRSLLLPCKTERGPDSKRSVRIFRWSLDTRSVQSKPAIEIPEHEIRRVLPGKNFHPSGIALDRESGHYFIVSARENAILEIAPTGVVVGGAMLSRKLHPHAEGIAIGAESELLISDEGDDRRARLARYPRRAAD